MRKISWWVPRWSFARRHIREELYTLRRNSFRRILVASLVGSAVIVGLCKAAIPDLDLHGLWRLPLGLVGLAAGLGFNLFFLLILIPPHLTVSSDELRYSHGETGWVARREDCTSFRLVVFSPSFRRLIFRYNGKRRSIGLAEWVDLDELRDLLPYPVKRVDAQQRFARFRRHRVSARPLQ